MVTELTAADPYEKIMKRDIKINRECQNAMIKLESMDFANKEHLTVWKGSFVKEKSGKDKSLE